MEVVRTEVREEAMNEVGGESTGARQSAAVCHNKPHGASIYCDKHRDIIC